MDLHGLIQAKLNPYTSSRTCKKTYAKINKSNVLVDGELFYGWQHGFNSFYQGQLGLAVAGTSNAKLKGDIWEDADPDFNNYVYK
ncbi:MAG: hypothetical protein PSV35_04365 [bacterium]|nr:hypothetical protein [bacterium]